MDSRNLYYWLNSFIALAVLMITCGCSPRIFSVEGPYTEQNLSAKQLSDIAAQSCNQKPKDPAEPIISFTSDGCSVVPDGIWGDDAWRECCVLHDVHYWCGGSSADRIQADRQLQQCVAEKGYPIWGQIMYVGVRAGGHPLWPVPWRWGYGWPWYRNYEKE